MIAAMARLTAKSPSRSIALARIAACMLSLCSPAAIA